jgi:hypothetical protein
MYFTGTEKPLWLARHSSQLATLVAEFGVVKFLFCKGIGSMQIKDRNIYLAVACFFILLIAQEGISTAGSFYECSDSEGNMILTD